jgi:hypothetical protein
LTAPPQRKPPGKPIAREQLVAEWEDLRRRNVLKGPVASFRFEVHYSEPEKTYQWRIQLDCGCVRDVLTRHPTDDKPADKVERLDELAETYHFAHVKPSHREIHEANQHAGMRAEQVDHPDQGRLANVVGVREYRTAGRQSQKQWTSESVTLGSTPDASARLTASSLVAPTPQCSSP